MNTNLSDFKEFIRNKKIAVLGAGISNQPLIQFLYQFNHDITVFDRLDADHHDMRRIVDGFERSGCFVRWVCGNDYLKQLKGYQVVFRTPGIRNDTPELIQERNRGCIITSEMEVFLRLCPSRTLGITGSDGKTTTTTLVGLFLEHEGYTVHVGGNIGTPLLNRIDTISPEDIAVVELSSFQLQSMRTSPNRALITNLSKNHLDVHKSYREYIEAKTMIFMHQSFMDTLYLNNEDSISRGFQKKACGAVRWFLKKEDAGYYIDDQTLFLGKFGSIARSRVLLRGTHNMKNICAAVAMVEDLVSEKSVHDVVTSFRGVEHRNEYIDSIRGIPFYNSSIDSSPGRTIATLQTYADEGTKLVVILGGKDKNSDYRALGAAILQVSRKIILCGQNASQIKESIEQAMRDVPQTEARTIRTVSDYDEAVRIASDMACSGEAVVFTPAGTSFDRYRNFEERGLAFKKAVCDYSAK